VRVVMLTPGLPQPTGSGAAIRNWSILRFLREGLGATVSLLTFDRGRLPSGSLPLPAGVDVTVLPTPARDWRRRARVLATPGQADLADRLWSAEAQARLLLHALREPTDILHIGGLEVARYALEVARHRGATGGPAIVLDDYNAEYTLQRRAFETDIRHAPRWPVAAYSAVQWWRLARFERAACLAADGVVCVSDEDASALARLTGQEPPVVIPNGVDCERHGPPPETAEPPPRFDLVFSGTMDYRPNVDAARWLVGAVWPLLRARFPALTLALVGQQPAPAVRRLAAAPGVTVTGAVPDDRPYLWGAGLYAVPMRYGGGVRLKLLNALATGCPVVTTSMGAEGVAARHGLHLMVADRPDQWLRLVTRVLTEPALRDRLREGGRQLVLERYQWRDLVTGFAGVYAAARERRAAAVAAGAGSAR
jgi:polysaccharide biosynthesis protein PslH